MQQINSLWKEYADSDTFKLNNSSKTSTQKEPQTSVPSPKTRKTFPHLATFEFLQRIKPKLSTEYSFA